MINYDNLHIIPEINAFGYVYDEIYGLGIYLGFSPIQGYTYQFKSKIINTHNFDPLPTIQILKDTPITIQDLQEVNS